MAGDLDNHALAATWPPTCKQDVNPKALDWDSPHDPDDPRNKPLLERILSAGIITLLAFCCAFAGSVIAPAEDQLTEAFGCTSEVAVLPMSLYMLGLSFGPLVGAPISEQFGRKAVFLGTTPVCLAFSLGASFAQSMPVLLICRFLAAVFASPNINNASATILDYTAPRYRGSMMALYYSVPATAASMAALSGGLIVNTRSWRWTQWTAIIMIMICYVPVFFTKETYKRRILEVRAEKRGLAIAAAPSESRLRHLLAMLIKRPLHMLFTEPIVALVSLSNGVLFGLIYVFVTSIPFIFETYFGFGTVGQSLSFLGAIIGTLFSSVPYAVADKFHYQKVLGVNSGAGAHVSPKHRLPASMVASILLPISLLISGWTAEARVHWILPILFQGVAMASSMVVYASTNLFMVDTYGPLYGASAASASMFSRYGMSFAFPLFTPQMYRALGAGWATTLLGGVTALLAPIPWIFWRYCDQLLEKSAYERST